MTEAFMLRCRQKDLDCIWNRLCNKLDDHEQVKDGRVGGRVCNAYLVAVVDFRTALVVQSSGDRIASYNFESCEFFPNLALLLRLVVEMNFQILLFQHKSPMPLVS